MSEIFQPESLHTQNNISYSQLMILAERYKEQFPETVHILDIA